MKRIALGILPLLILVACDGTLPTGTDAPEALAPGAPDHAEGAYQLRGTYDTSFGPVSISAPCLADHVEDDVMIGGTWTVRAQVLIGPTGRVHWVEHLDYSDVHVTAGDLTWLPGPGAHEHIQWLGDMGGTRGRNVMHAFHARYLSQDGLPDLRVSHTIHRVWGPEGTLIRSEGVPPTFSAECLGRE